MRITYRTEILIEFFCILILIFLNFAVWYNGKNLDCDKCTIDFKAIRREHETASNKVFQNFSVPIVDIYNNFLNGDCLVKFDKDNGYYLFKKWV